MTAVDIDSGQTLWRSRAVGRATFVRVGSRVVMLSEDGKLVLATPTQQGLDVEAEAQILDSVAWTPPTIVGDIMLVRNRKVIVAYSLQKVSAVF